MRKHSEIRVVNLGKLQVLHHNADDKVDACAGPDQLIQKQRITPAPSWESRASDSAGWY